MERTKKQQAKKVQEVISDKQLEKITKDLKADSILIVVYQKNKGTAVSSHVRGVHATINIMEALEQTKEQMKAKMMDGLSSIVDGLEDLVKKVVKSDK